MSSAESLPVLLYEDVETRLPLLNAQVSEAMAVGFPRSWMRSHRPPVTRSVMPPRQRWSGSCSPTGGASAKQRSACWGQLRRIPDSPGPDCVGDHLDRAVLSRAPRAVTLCVPTGMPGRPGPCSFRASCPVACPVTGCTRTWRIPGRNGCSTRMTLTYWNIRVAFTPSMASSLRRSAAVVLVGAAHRKKLVHVTDMLEADSRGCR
jgi:hypothetical protein